MTEKSPESYSEVKISFLSTFILSQSSGGDGDAQVSRKAISALRKTCANEQKNSPLAKRKI